MFDCITIGDIKLDTFVVLPEDSRSCQLKMPEFLLCVNYGEKIPIGDVESQIAGSAPNVAVGLSRLGCKTSVLSFIGGDGTGKLAIDTLKKEKVDTRLIKSLKNKKSSFSVVLNYKGEKTILANHVSYPYRITSLPKTKWVYVCEMGHDYKKLYRELARYVKKQKIKLGINPGTIQIQERDKVLYDLINVCEVLFVNIGEAHSLTKQEGNLKISHLAPALYKLGPKKIVITDGRKGAYSFDGAQLDFCPTFPTKRVEATGAGDAFSTGFIGALLKKLDSKQALLWGTANGASVVSMIGPQPGLLNVQQINSWIKKYPRIKARKV